MKLASCSNGHEELALGFLVDEAGLLVGDRASQCFSRWRGTLLRGLLTQAVHHEEAEVGWKTGENRSAAAPSRPEDLYSSRTSTTDCAIMLLRK